MEGKSDFKVRKGFEDSWHTIWADKTYIYSCPKTEVPKLFSNDFWYIYEVWQYFHEGFGLPGGKAWDDLDPTLVRNLLNMERHYKRHFSMDTVKIKYMEALIKRMDAYLGKRR